MNETISRGARGVRVIELRDILIRLGLLADEQATKNSKSDLFDEAVEVAVRAFQQSRGLISDGIVGSHTLRALDEARWRLGDRVIRMTSPMMRGDDVGLLQTRLMEMGFDLGRIDGIFGPRSCEALIALQKSVGISGDGMCGPETFLALRRLQRTITGGIAQGLRESAFISRRGPALSGKKIVIDPGHGGTDVGCSAHGLKESEVVLDIAQRIEGRLGALGVAVYLTRGAQSDQVDDGRRAQFANSSGADLFVSLHLDANPHPEARGTSTYFYGNDAHGAHSLVGERLASLIQRELCARTDLLDCRIHAKTWELLRHTRMPAVRVELAYVTNPGDASRLTQADFREVLAESIAVAIQRLYLPDEGDGDTGILRLADLRI